MRVIAAAPAPAAAEKKRGRERPRPAALTASQTLPATGSALVSSWAPRAEALGSRRPGRMRGGREGIRTSQPGPPWAPTELPWMGLSGGGVQQQQQ